MSSTLVIKPSAGVDFSITTTSTGSFLVEIDARYFTSGAGGYEAVALSKDDAIKIIQFLHEELIHYNFRQEA